MEHNYSVEYQNVRIRPLKRSDIEMLRIWRNDKEKTKFLRQIGYISAEMQNSWFDGYLKDNSILTFAIEETQLLNRLVGSVALYDISSDRAEIGKIQIGDSQAHGKGIGRAALVLVSYIGFTCFGLREIIASVHQDNISSHTNFLRVGFEINGFKQSVVGGLEDTLVINFDKLVKVNPFVTSLNIER